LDRLQSGQKFPEVGGRDHLGSRRRLSQNSLTSAVAAAAVAVASPARTGCLRLVHSGTPSPASRTIAAQDTPSLNFARAARPGGLLAERATRTHPYESAERRRKNRVPEKPRKCLGIGLPSGYRGGIGAC